MWDSKQAGLPACATAPRRAALDAFIVEAGRVDRIAKGRAPGDAWQVLERLLLAIAEPRGMALLVS